MGDNCILDCNVADIILGVLFWVSLYGLMRKVIFRKQNSEFSSRIVAAVHALIVTPLAYYCYIYGPNPFRDGAGEPNIELHTLTLKISLSYFIYDFGWCIYFGTEPYIMIVHHISSISSLAIILVIDKSGAEAVAGLGTMEASNPYLQLRWILRTYGYNHTLMHTFVELYFFVLFLVMRLGVGSLLTYNVLISPNVLIIVKGCTVLLYLVSVAFVYYIFQFIRKKYIHRLGPKSLSDEKLKKEL